MSRSITIDQLLIGALENIGAIGIAHPECKLVSDYRCKMITALKYGLNVFPSRTYHGNYVVVWASGFDGKLFHSAEERDAYDDANYIACSNEEHYHHKAVGNLNEGNRSYKAFKRACLYENMSGYCSECTLSDGKTNCLPRWDISPYGITLDKRKLT